MTEEQGSELGVFLRDSRISAGLSQKDVAARLGYKSGQVISDWERGLRSPPGMVLRKLVGLYHVPVEKFMEIILKEKTAIVERKLRKSLGLSAKESVG